MLNYSEAVRKPSASFKLALEKAGMFELIGDEVVTKRLKKRGIKLFAAPRLYSGGSRGSLGRIHYAAAVSTEDAEAMAALKEEREKLDLEIRALREKRENR